MVCLALNSRYALVCFFQHLVCMTGAGSYSHSFANYVFLVTCGSGNARTRPEIVRELAVFRGDGI